MKYILLTILAFGFVFFPNAQSLKSLKGNAFSDEVLGSTLYKTNQEKITLAQAFEEVKGDAILIEFWASWCKTCAREMEYSRELEKQYKGKKIVFMFLSTDTDYKQWLLGLGRVNIDGKHYRIDESSKKNIKEFLKIKGIPYYVLVDKEGYIFDPKASWPHLETLKNEIDLLLSL